MIAARFLCWKLESLLYKICQARRVLYCKLAVPDSWELEDSNDGSYKTYIKADNWKILILEARKVEYKKRQAETDLY